MPKNEIALAILIAFCQISAAQTAGGGTQGGQSNQNDLTNLDVSDLANMQVTTASKKAESLISVPAAIYVVTAEDIKRTGAINIPEALRMVPGVEVTQYNAYQYAVSVRGFNGVYADKLLVLIDGRSIYNNLFGGVYWEDQNISMDEIDRIEVIRGPGGTIWGANAVNGVINIITKNAKDTKGLYMSAEGGTKLDAGTGTIRYGSSLSHGDFRVTAYGLRRDQTLTLTDTQAGDDWGGERLSGRYDGGSEQTGKLLFEGDIHKFDFRLNGATYSPNAPYEIPVSAIDPSTGGSILARAEKTFKDGSNDSIQATYDKTYKYDSSTLIIRDTTLDFELQHGFKQLGKNGIITGLSYRNTNDDYSGPGQLLSPAAANFSVFSGFVQDQIDFDTKHKFVIGTKLEHNDFSGWEVEPSARYAVTPDPAHAYWFSVSRAVRTPNRANTDANVDIGVMPTMNGTILETLLGNKNNPSTDLVAAEAGYRATINSKTSFDASLFNNSYTHLNGILAGSPGAPTEPGYIATLPINIIDAGNGTTRGLELSTKVQVTPKWRLDFGYAYEYGDIPAAANAFATPRHEIKELSTYSITSKLSFDQAIYFAGANSDGTPSYTRFDFQARYKPTERLEFAVGGRNLGEGQYAQSISGTFGSPSLVQPELYAQASVKF